MKYVSMKVVGLLACVSLLGLTGRDANADVITIPGAACAIVPFSGSAGGPGYLVPLQNGGVTNPDTSLREIVCPVPKVTGSSPPASRSVWIDGDAAASSPINCTAFSYNLVGGLNGSVAYGLKTGPAFDASVSFTGGTAWDYYTVKCTLGPNSGSTFRGVAVSQ